MNLVDSCGWLEFFADGPSAESFVAPLSDPATLIVPAITVYEVFKIVLRQKDEDAALQAVAMMQQGMVVELDASLAMEAAKTSLDLKLPMADSNILVTARRYEACIWTQDEHFRDLPEVRYFPKLFIE